MALFKSKEEKEDEKLEKINQKMAQYGLDDLSQEDKERVRLTLKLLTGTTLIAITGSAEDNAKIGLMQAMIEQNFMIIKLLNEINTKLDK